MHDLAQRYYVVSYTNVHPEILPDAANRLVGDRRVKNVSVSACYARTATYIRPGGACGSAFFSTGFLRPLWLR